MADDKPKLEKDRSDTNDEIDLEDEDEKSSPKPLKEIVGDKASDKVVLEG